MENAVLILVSHGKMAKETLKSAELIVGNIEGAYALSVAPKDSAAKVRQKMEEVMNSLHGAGQVVVMVDVIGGTPCNVAVTEWHDEERIHIISGFNLAMVLEFVTSRENNIHALKEHILEVGKSQITDIKKNLGGDC